jgi:hypothetical protein
MVGSKSSSTTSGDPIVERTVQMPIPKFARQCVGLDHEQDLIGPINKGCCLGLHFPNQQEPANRRHQPFEFDRLGIEVIAPCGYRLFPLTG